MSGGPLSLAELKTAAVTIAPQATVTPVVTSAVLDELVGASVFCKVEAAQQAGSFKFRGAFNRLSNIPDDERAPGVVAVSSGNHGAAVAQAARILSMPAVIFIPQDTPTAKRSLIEAAGADVVTFDRTTDDREALALERVQDTGATFIHPFEDRQIMAGQGTTAVELNGQIGPLDALLVPVSGGGLLAGCASAMYALDPTCQIVGVEPSIGDDTRRSFEAGHPVTIEQPTTMADGLAVVSPGAATFAINRELVARIETVTEEQIAEAMLAIWEHLQMAIEPSGAVGIAALMNGAVARIETKEPPRVGVVLSGGNIDAARFNELTGG